MANPANKTMPFDVFLALFVFAVVSSVTPGPNNFMVLASGVNFGFRRTIPHMMGVAIGFAVLVLAVGFGLGALLKTFPALHTALKVAGGAYLLYLAWKIGTTRSLSGRGEGAAAPLTFRQAAAFQWVNPKAWVLALTAIAVYAMPDAPLTSIGLVIAIFTVIIPPTLALWTVFGTGLRNWLADPVRLKWFNIGMGVLLAATLWPMLR
jgi:threonine/homoserine/homoserine lactone efflux protein